MVKSNVDPPKHTKDNLLIQLIDEGDDWIKCGNYTKPNRMCSNFTNINYINYINYMMTSEEEKKMMKKKDDDDDGGGGGDDNKDECGQAEVAVVLCRGVYPKRGRLALGGGMGVVIRISSCLVFFFFSCCCCLFRMFQKFFSTSRWKSLFGFGSSDSHLHRW